MSDLDEATTPVLPPAKLLLVDDQPVNLRALEAVLAPLGATLVTARSGPEALKQLLREECDFAAILLDVQMPGMDGFEAARLIKERERSRYIPILFLTAGDDPRFAVEAYATGAVDFLSKPFHPYVLRAKVSVFIDLHRQREEIRRQERMLRQGWEREEALRHEIRQRDQEQQYLTELAKRESEKAALSRQVEEMARQQRIFLREVLSSLSEGRLRLCDAMEELPPALPLFSEPVTLSRPTLRTLRHLVTSFGKVAEWQDERTQDLETAVGEAGMNAVVHGRGARGTVRGIPTSGTAQVWVEDQGGGIAEKALHRATLERGYTTAGTLGHGFWMMLKTADRIHLLTGKSGTTVVLEQDRVPPDPPWIHRSSNGIE